MSQNYNINMKKFNGTDYDGLLPLAYNALNSQQLDGKTFNEIQNLFESNYVELYSRSYNGTGLYDYRNPTTITFPFQPSIIIMPRQAANVLEAHEFLIYITSELPTDSYMGSGINDAFYIKKSADGKSITWYATAYNSSNGPIYQLNEKDVKYYFAGIGGYDQRGQVEWILTSTQTWAVPRTGRYYIELYGGGGRAGCPKGRGCSGRSSCQSYNNISLSERQEISVTIGTGGNSVYGTSYEYADKGTSGTKTTFGTYSVNGGNVTNYGGTYTSGWSIQAGAAAGNLGTAGYEGVKNNTSGYAICNYSTGRYGDKYGYGGYAKNNTNDWGSVNGGPRAVYLKYLGA